MHFGCRLFTAVPALSSAGVSRPMIVHVATVSLGSTAPVRVGSDDLEGANSGRCSLSDNSALSSFGVSSP